MFQQAIRAEWCHDAMGAPPPDSFTKISSCQAHASLHMDSHTTSSSSSSSSVVLLLICVDYYNHHTTIHSSKAVGLTASKARSYGRADFPFSVLDFAQSLGALMWFHALEPAEIGRSTTCFPNHISVFRKLKSSPAMSYDQLWWFGSPARQKRNCQQHPI